MQLVVLCEISVKPDKKSENNHPNSKKTTRYKIVPLDYPCEKDDKNSCTPEHWDC